MMRGGYALFGVNEFGARAHSIVCTLALMGLVYGMGCRWFGPRIGLYAAAALPLTLQFLIHGRSTVADLPMVLGVAAAHLAWFELLCDGRDRYPWPWFWTAYLGLGLGFLAKGPIALLVPLVTLALYRWVIWRRPIAWRRLKFGWGGLVVLGVLAPWGIPALILTQGEFWDVGIGYHVVERGVRAFNSRLFLPFYYPLTALISLFPWIAFAGGAWLAIRARWSRSNAWLLSWFLSPYLIFLFYSTQLPHYVMPGYPAFLLMVAQAAGGAAPELRWGKILLWLAGIVAAVAYLAMLALTLLAPPLRPVGVGGMFLVAGLTAAGLLYWRPTGPGLAVAVVLAGAGTILIAQGLRSVSPAVQLAQSAFGEIGPSTGLFWGRFQEPSLVFYSRAGWLPADNEQIAVDILRRSPDTLMVLKEAERDLEDALVERMNRWRGLKGPVPGKDHREENQRILAAASVSPDRVLRVDGVNVARSSWVTLLCVEPARPPTVTEPR
jgi:4-amino-4-deoxy-L-arabinose transferase-like glycosyltransferase